MKAIAGYLFIAVVLALIGMVCIGAGRLDRDMARGEQSLSALKYDEADQAFASAERYYDYASSLPWVGKEPVNDIRARRAALRYWQGQYGAVTSQQPDPDNIDLQLVAANAQYRSGRLEAKDRQKTLQAVDTSIQAYLGVLKNAKRQEDAAFNYEYLARLRQELLLGRGAFRLPPGFGDPNGTAGSILEPGDTGKFNIYVPLEKEERDKAGGAGKAAPIKRKG
jgi:hypothetical protein